ncbi:DUF1758 domain-containing protein [Trichonephila clavipes]|nr:DUF1758 domain-containing protein [Trichonephila clavipes]
MPDIEIDDYCLLEEIIRLNKESTSARSDYTHYRTSLENVDSPLNQVEIRTKLASLSEGKAKIDKLRTESYRVLSDEELMDFEASLDTMEVDADNLESHLRAIKQLELEPNALCESMLILVITQRLDDESRKQYERELHSKDLPKFHSKRTIELYYFCNFIQDQVDRNLTKFWDLEAIGIKAESSCDPDDQAMQHFKSSIRFNSGRYEVGFPWKGHTQELNDNFSVAEKRVKSLTRRFIHDPTLYIQYSKILK